MKYLRKYFKIVYVEDRAVTYLAALSGEEFLHPPYNE